MQAKTANNLKVIDVSHHQQKIDWKAVASDGVVGAFIKASEGKSYIDLKFSSNALGAAMAGLKVGFYHYAHPEDNDPKVEAAHFAKTVKGTKADFPHVLDVEGEASKVGPTSLTAWCETWLQEVERLTGHPTMIYTGASFARTYLRKSLGKWPLWIAHYDTDKPMSNNTWPVWAAFQYTDEGAVKGITRNVDINAMERAFYDQYAGKPAVPQPTAEDTIKIVVNDKLAAYGRIVNGHAFLPLRQLGEALGVDVHWDATTATPYVGGKVITNFQLIGGKTYLGIRSAAELLGGSVSWDGETKKVYLYK
ncbi:GH25 family lysozyme [Paenibacillus silvisoli]|uniref:GH25 family lysozyme n=1 Tax=Paenibacillus silvisoli TaxID=3110539 RepID=UPI00280656AD|nr:GH25 family lysozyme [Paenibacillus silvisoli]